MSIEFCQFQYCLIAEGGLEKKVLPGQRFCHVVQISSGLVLMLSRKIMEVRQRVLNAEKKQESDQEEHTGAWDTVLTAFDGGIAVMWVVSELPETLASF